MGTPRLVRISPPSRAVRGQGLCQRPHTDAAPSYTVVNLRAGFEQAAGAWTLREFVRVNNIGDRDYVGSVIVGDINTRFFEPSARRNYLIGVTANAKF